MTARVLFHQCRRAGIILSADGDGIRFDAPPGVVVPVEEIRQIKPELLMVLYGRYLDAAAALLTRLAGKLPDEVWWGWDERFTERADLCAHDGNMGRGEAERRAYLEMARAVEAWE